MDHLAHLKALQATIHYQFKELSLLERALTHPSVLKTKKCSPFERCEFLGDRSLGLVIASALYEKFPDEREGELAKKLAFLVRKETLALLANDIGLGKAILLSQGERKFGGAKKASILANAFEALLGAQFLDGGYQAVEKTVHILWGSLLENLSADDCHDPKTMLQEQVQALGKALPIYETVSANGPDHAPLFVMEVIVEGLDAALGEGASKKTATQAAAQNMLNKMEKKRT